MTSSTELAAGEARPEGPLGGDWRAATERAQEQALSPGRHTVSCSAPLGEGGLGRHMQELVDALTRRGEPTSCLSGAHPRGEQRPGTAARGLRSRLPSQSELLGALPIPIAPAVRTRAFMVDYDRSAAARLPGGDRLIAFNGQAVAQFRAARAAGYGSLTLLSANSHLRRVVAQHARAHRAYPLEGSWATRLLKRNLAEYAQAERIYVASRYTRESFLAEGVPEDKLTLFPFTPHPRYRAARHRHPRRSCSRSSTSAA